MTCTTGQLYYHWLIHLLLPYPSERPFSTPPHLAICKGTLLPQSFNPFICWPSASIIPPPQQHSINRFHYYAQLSDHRPLMKVLKKRCLWILFTCIFSLAPEAARVHLLLSSLYTVLYTFTQVLKVLVQHYINQMLCCKVDLISCEALCFLPPRGNRKKPNPNQPNKKNPPPIK